jgi:arabinose-5-phosphate isomerase
MTNLDIKNIAKDTIEQETKAINNLLNYIDDDFVQVVNKIYSSKGRVIITGIGKSANIAEKIVSTFNSTGTVSVFMHAAEAIHGDLGMIQKDDIVICVSKSGNTPEIKVLIPLIKANHNLVIALVGDKESFLAKSADYIIRCDVDKEADPNNLAPTCSTTAQLVMGDSLAVCLLNKRGFTAKDFAKYHPGGSLGKRLYLKVSDLYINNEKPQISPLTPLNEALIEITSKRLGCSAVIDNDKIVGIITDGDLRRMLSKQNSSITLDILAKDVMSKTPKTINEEAFAVEALEMMRNNHITQLLVTDTKGKYLGVIHLHDLIQEGII